jgi:ADP-heptose:LPS heptosyltransferase
MAEIAPDRAAMVVRRVLIYRLGSLGDTVVALPALHLVRRVFPQAQLSLLTNKPVASKAAAMESVLGPDFFAEVIDYPVGTRNPAKLLAVARRIRAGKFDVLVNLSAARGRFKALRDRCFVRLAGISRVVGSPSARADFRVSLPSGSALYESETRRLLRRVGELGSISLDDAACWDLLLTAGERQAGESHLPTYEYPTIACCFGTKMEAKDWGRPNWEKLVSRLGETLPDWRLAVIGSGDEADLAERCATGWRGPVVNLCGRLSPRESAAVLESCVVFIGHDSGPMHLASAVGTPCVAIFSARNLPGQWFPARPGHSIIYHKTDCFGCMLERCVAERKRCILSITVDEVFDAAMESLRSRGLVR